GTPAMAAIASTPQSVRKVTSSTGNPPAPSARAKGSACSIFSITRTGITGPSWHRARVVWLCRAVVIGNLRQGALALRGFQSERQMFPLTMRFGLGRGPGFYVRHWSREVDAEGLER